MHADVHVKVALECFTYMKLLIVNNALFLEQEAILFQKESKCCPGLEEAADFWNGQGIHVPQ